jgi:hypothetical protein
MQEHSHDQLHLYLGVFVLAGFQSVHLNNKSHLLLKVIKRVLFLLFPGLIILTKYFILLSSVLIRENTLLLGQEKLSFSFN